jgi:sporulation protein YlmC with PRC-barrel domain
MKQKSAILTGGLIAFCLPLQAWAQATPPRIPTEAKFGPEVTWKDITDIQITNRQGEPLGRIQDLALDLTHGRVVEVLIGYGEILRLGGKTIAVPPQALITDVNKKLLQINMSVELFKTAPKFILSKWTESTQPDVVADAYHYFGQELNFLAFGEDSGGTTDADRPVASLGSIEKMSSIMGLEVDDLNGQKLGRLESLSLDVANGRILNAFIAVRQRGSPFQYQTVVPPTLLSFNKKHNGLLLDVSKVSYRDEPHIILEDGAGSQAASFRKEAATGPHPDVALVQGTSFRDINTTAKIYRAMQEGKLDTFGVQAATLEGRVTLRGSVDQKGIKDGIGAIAIAIVRLDKVDNQINVTPSAALSPASSDSIKEAIPPAQSSP